MKENQLKKELLDYIEKVAELAAEAAIAKFDREMFEEESKKNKRISSIRCKKTAKKSTKLENKNQKVR